MRNQLINIFIFHQVHKVNGEWSETSESLCVTEEMKAYENTAYEMNNLEADTYYRIRLRAHNLIGYSASSEMYMKTARGKWNGDGDEETKKAGFYNVYYSHITTSEASNAYSSTRLVLGLVSLFWLCSVR